MIELNMFKELNTEVKTIFKSIKLERIENSMVNGMPDAHYTIPFHEGWIELKQVYIRKDGSFDIPYRPGQFPWIREYLKIKCESTVYLICTIKHLESEWLIFNGDNIKKTYKQNEYKISTLKEIVKYFYETNMQFFKTLK